MSDINDCHQLTEQLPRTFFGGVAPMTVKMFIITVELSDVVS